jgi:hypothetical protein
MITCADAELAVRGRGPPPVPRSTSLVFGFCATADRVAVAAMPTVARNRRRLVAVIVIWRRFVVGQPNDRDEAPVS